MPARGVARHRECARMGESNPDSRRRTRRADRRTGAPGSQEKKR